MKRKGYIILALLIFLFLPTFNSKAADSMSLNKEKLLLEPGEKAVLRVKSGKRRVVWSADTDCVSLKVIRNKAVIKGLTPGKTIIKAKIGKRILKCNVKVARIPFCNRSPKLCTYYPQAELVQWKKVAGADGYIVYKKNNKGAYQFLKKVKGGSKTYLKDSCDTPHDATAYKVKAYRRINGKLVYSKAVKQKYILE